MADNAPAEFLNAEALLAAIIDSTDDAIISKNLDGIVTSWNQGAERIFGFKAEEMVGQPILNLIPAERRAEETEILARLRRGERVDHFETERLRRDGSLVPVSLTISPVKNLNGQIVGASKIARDISQRREAEEKIRQTVAEAERQSRLKDDFLATLSHELRTPLQSITGWIQILRGDDVEPAELQQGLEVIERNAQSQTRIIEDLLDMSRILSGKVRLDVQKVNLTPLIEAALETVKPAAAAKEIRVHAVIDPLAKPVAGDPNRLQQIFWNLLSNAIKFTPRGGRVQVLLERVNSHLEVSVTDSGAGISPEFLPFVFERFRQADSSTTRQHAGLGLGLAIVKHLAELHGGSARVKSAGEGFGSTFAVMLPLAAVATEPDEGPLTTGVSRATAPVQARPRLEGVEVLVVDDEEDARTSIAKILSKAGAQVTAVPSVTEALASVKRHPPAVLVSDIGMPGHDGYALISAVRALPAQEGGAIPAVALTAYTRTEDRIKSIAAGFQMHLSKPVDGLELLTVVASLAKFGTSPPDTNAG